MHAFIFIARAPPNITTYRSPTTSTTNCHPYHLLLPPTTTTTHYHYCRPESPQSAVDLPVTLTRLVPNMSRASPPLPPATATATITITVTTTYDCHLPLRVPLTATPTTYHRTSTEAPRPCKPISRNSMLGIGYTASILAHTSTP